MTVGQDSELKQPEPCLTLVTEIKMLNQEMKSLKAADRVLSISQQITNNIVRLYQIKMLN